jgi:hypothetical protein
VILVADPEELVTRLPLRDANAPHPRDAFSPDELRGQMQYALDALVSFAATRDFAHVIDVSGMDTGTARRAVASVIA